MLLLRIIYYRLIITVAARTVVQKPQSSISIRPTPRPPPPPKQRNSADHNAAVFAAVASVGSGSTSTPAIDLRVNNPPSATENPIIGNSLGRDLEVQKPRASPDATPAYPVEAEVLIETGRSSLQVYNEKQRNFTQNAAIQHVPQCSAVCSPLKAITSKGDGTFVCFPKLSRRKRTGEEPTTSCSKSGEFLMN
ncbi:hypothetical protein DdX_18000 [Ditylenchus destructor]|uniref:Uncharacterized protein n=1 Tax=Ditylenchus destructor TaxID=166010 RepID=A0AAD4MN42_9BILA|nr:hypothetical protein DdX_18000 [Ditylenchus destructor]